MRAKLIDGEKRRQDEREQPHHRGQDVTQRWPAVAGSHDRSERRRCQNHPRSENEHRDQGRCEPGSGRAVKAEARLPIARVLDQVTLLAKAHVGPD